MTEKSRAKQMIDKVKDLINQKPVQDVNDFMSLLEEIFVEQFAPKYFFYFEREDLLPEVKFLYGNQAANEINANQYFYQFKDMAFQLLGRPPQVINEISPNAQKNSFSSALFYPVNFTQATKGMIVLGNPNHKKKFELSDLDFIKDVMQILQTSIDNIKLQRSIKLYETEIALIDKITYVVDMATMAGFFFKCLGQLIEEAIDCQIVIFLMLNDEKGIYTLEAGNDMGCEFWVNQTEFFRSLAQESEHRGIFTETYGGKFFKGEKYGLEQLETALVIPINFYQLSRGVFILLNKNGQKNFSSFDIRLIRLLSGYSKSVIYREIEKKKLGTLFKRFVSEKIGDKILNNEDYNLELEGRQRITALFIDINGFTSFTETTDAAIVTKQLNTYFEEMTNLIIKHDGSLDKYLGDGIMAIFGSPIQITNHAERAVECALAMQNKMSEITQKWIDEGLHALTASIGLQTGEALVGAIGCDKFLDYTAIGDVVNVGSRLCGAARHGTILIGEPTWECMQDVLLCDYIHGLKLKGKSQSLPAFEVHGLKNIYEIREMLRHADPVKKLRIIAALGNFHAYCNSDIVLDYLNDELKEVRLAVVESISRLNKEYHMNVVINHLEYEKNEQIRGCILSLISDIVSDPLEPLIEKVMKGVATGVRPTILNATLRSPYRDDKRLFLALIKALQDNEEFQTSMIADLTTLLYQTDDIPILRLLIDSLPNARQTVKISIINALAKIETPQVAAPLVRTMETEKDLEIRYAITRAFGKISNEKTIKLLGLLFLEIPELKHWYKYILCRQTSLPINLYRELLNDPDPVLRYAALILISQKMPTEMENELLEMLPDTNDIPAQIKIIECLKRCPAEKIFPIYLKLLGTNPLLDARIIGELGFRKQKQHLDLIHKYFHSENPSLKIQAILAAGQIADPSSLPLLKKAFDEQENANNTATIIRVLGNFQSDQVLLRIVQALSSPIGRIRANAIDSLIAMNATQTVNQIERLLQDDNNRARANAALACLRFGRIQHFSVLAEMASSTNKWMRLSCLWALSVTGMPEAREIILGLIRDPDYDVLLSAVSFLKRIDRENNS